LSGLADVLVENADMTCIVRTDHFNMYHPLGMMFRGGHETVKHSAREYKRHGTDVHTNTIEGVFSLIKRGVMGTFHSWMTARGWRRRSNRWTASGYSTASRGQPAVPAATEGSDERTV